LISGKLTNSNSRLKGIICYSPHIFSSSNIQVEEANDVNLTWN